MTEKKADDEKKAEPQRYEPDNELRALPGGSEKWSDEAKALWLQMASIDEKLKFIIGILMKN